FSYFDSFLRTFNRPQGATVGVFHEQFGLEQAFLDGDASIGLRLPLSTLNVDSGAPGVAGAGTIVGDLAVIFKYAFWQDTRAGDLLAAGLAVVAPTGPDHFPGFAPAVPLHNTTFQPFLGYLFHAGDFYLHGFSAVDVPTDARDVTLMYNDIGLGYFLFQG